MNSLHKHYLLSCKYLSVNMYFLVMSLGFVKALLDSPCPEIFQYRYDNANNLYGALTVDCPKENSVIQLNAEIAVGNNIQGYNGNLELAYSRQQSVDDAVNRRPIHYTIRFPYWNGIPPKLTKITLNGNQICAGPSIDSSSASVITMINLRHTLKINFPSKQGPYYGSYGNSDNSEWLYMDDMITPRSQYDFNPPKSGNMQTYTVNFQPQRPKNPDKVYSGNPFLSKISTTPPSNSFVPSNNPFLGMKPVTQPVPTYTKTHYSQNPFLNSVAPGFSQNGQKVFPTGDALAPVQNKFNDDGIFNTRLPSASSVQQIGVKNSFPTASTSEDSSSGFECGVPHNSNSLIFKGESLTHGAFPWLAALFLQNVGELKFQCGGTLISKKHVVTAAHCVKQPDRRIRADQVLIILGRHNIQKWIDGVVIEALELSVHPEYQDGTADADIAVVTLSESVSFNKYIKPICLWSEDIQLELIVGLQGTVAGWGTGEDGILLTNAPKKVQLPIVTQQDCLWSNDDFYQFTSNRTFCAGSRNGTGPCNGDSGGGLVLQKGGRWMLRGVVSMSIRGTKYLCNLQEYIVFTDAAKFRDWLLQFLRQ